MDEYRFIAEMKEQKRKAREFIDSVMAIFTEGLSDEEIAKRRAECDREGHKEPLIPEDSIFYQPNTPYPTTRTNFCKYCGREYGIRVPAEDNSAILRKIIDI